VGGDYLEGISLQDIQITYGGGGTAEEARREIPPIAGEYFEMGTPPSYGLYARNVRGLSAGNLRFEVAAADERPAVVFDHVEDASVSGLNAQGNAHAESLLRFANCRDVLLAAPRLLAPVPAFLRVEGATSRNITVDGGDLTKAPKVLELGSDVARGAVRVIGQAGV
jgi:hypothetical protein